MYFGWVPQLFVGSCLAVLSSGAQHCIVLDRKRQAEGERQEGDTRLPAEVFIKAIQLFDLQPIHEKIPHCDDLN